MSKKNRGKKKTRSYKAIESGVAKLRERMDAFMLKQPFKRKPRLLRKIEAKGSH